METTQFWIEGKNDLKTINEIISFREEHDLEFMRSEIKAHNEVLANLVTFKVYETTPDPPLGPLILQPKEQAPPDPSKFSLIWTGKMVVSNNVTDVAAYRGPKPE